MEKPDIDAVDEETAEQGRIDSLDVSPAEKLVLRADARRRLDEATDPPPRPSTAQE